jgi:hypothetical protein
MTLTTKRRIAREWLIFLACIVIGFAVTYFSLYSGEQVRMGFTQPKFDPDAFLDDRPQPVPKPCGKTKIRAICLMICGRSSRLTTAAQIVSLPLTVIVTGTMKPLNYGSAF